MKVIAHRGASLEAPENTLSAFRLAKHLEADLIECDVHVSSEGIPVVIHDPYLGWDQLPPQCLPINETSLQEIKRYDVGHWFSEQFRGEKVPTLEEALDLDAQYLIEIKWAGEVYKNYVDPILSCAKNGNCILGCLVPEVVKYVHDKGFKTVGIVQSYTHLEKFISLQPAILALCQQLLTSEIIDTLHQKGTEVWGWTVDDVSIAKNFETMGLDGVITNNVRGIKACR